MARYDLRQALAYALVVQIDFAVPGHRSRWQRPHNRYSDQVGFIDGMTTGRIIGVTTYASSQSWIEMSDR